MSRRNETLSWLTSQARDHPDDILELDVMHSPDDIKSRAAAAQAKGDVALDEDLAWELVMGISQVWLDPGMPELKGMQSYDVANLLRLAVELADNARLDNSYWLALRAHAFYASRDAGVGAHDLPGLIDRLSSHHDAPLTNIYDTLVCLDAMIDSVGDESRRTWATVAAMSAVSYWTHYAMTSQATLGHEGSADSGITPIMDWLTGHANEVIGQHSISSRHRLEAYEAPCSAINVAAGRRLNNGLLNVSNIFQWFESRISEVTVPHITDPEFRISPQDVVRGERAYLAIRCAEWLVESGGPSAALEFLSYADKALPGTHYSTEASALVRATAYARLGLVRQAIKEIEDLRFERKPQRIWAFGRLLCETGDDRGLKYLRYAVDLTEDLGYQEEKTRMRLLLAEKEVEKGSPWRAVRVLEGTASMDDEWVSYHSRVILAEAYLAMAVSNSEQEEELLNRANEFLMEMKQNDIADTPDRILPRVFAAMGQVELLRARITSARCYFRQAMDELDQAPPTSWDRPGLVQGTEFTPDGFVSGSFWRRPWSRNWTRVAEMSLIAELEELADVEAAFTQLQRYRTITHSGTIVELAGFAPEASLNSVQHRYLEELRSHARQMEVWIRSMKSEVVQLKAAIGSPASTGPKLPELHQRLRVVRGQLEDKKEELKKCEEEIQLVDEEVDDTRGYLASAASIRRPWMHEIELYLDEADAAVVELVRLDGKSWGLSTRWVAFLITPGGIRVVQLSADGEDGIDRELRLLRNNRERLDWSALRSLSDLIVGKLPAGVFRHRNLFIAADGDAWTVPFRSLVRPKWWFVPRWLTDSEFYAYWPVPEAVKGWMDALATRLDSGVVTNVISTTHLIRLLESSREERERVGVVVGSSGNSSDRILCEGLAKSLEVAPPTSQQGGTLWKRYSGSLAANTIQNGDRPEWMHGTSEVFLASWHTTFTDDPTTVARFHFDDDSMTLAEFLSQSRHETDLAVILSCNISHPADNEFSAFHRIGSAGFGIMEALQADAVISTTNEVTPEVAFILGRILSTELTRGNDLHTALANSQEWLRECKVVNVISMLKELENNVPETAEWLRRLGSADPNSLAFPKACDTEPFYILGLPDVRMSKFN